MVVSRLSVSEFAQLPELTAPSTVSGSIAYLVGEEEPPEVSRVLKGLTRRRTHLIRAACERLEEQTVRRNASGVLGITVTTERTLREVGRANVGMTIEVTALGAAVVPVAEETSTITHSLLL